MKAGKPIALYNLNDDIAETTNVRQGNQAVVAKLLAHIDAFEKDIAQHIVTVQKSCTITAAIPVNTSTLPAVPNSRPPSPNIESGCPKRLPYPPVAMNGRATRLIDGSKNGKPTIPCPIG